MIRKFLLNAVNSWVTSSAGAILGVPEIWAGLQGMFDEDASTGADWGMVVRGAGILFALMMTRDHTKAIAK